MTVSKQDLVKSIYATVEAVEMICHAKSILAQRSIPQMERATKCNNLAKFQAELVQRITLDHTYFVKDDCHEVVCSIVNG